MPLLLFFLLLSFALSQEDIEGMCHRYAKVECSWDEDWEAQGCERIMTADNRIILVREDEAKYQHCLQVANSLASLNKKVYVPLSPEMSEESEARCKEECSKMGYSGDDHEICVEVCKDEWITTEETEGYGEEGGYEEEYSEEELGLPSGESCSPVCEEICQDLPYSDCCERCMNLSIAFPKKEVVDNLSEACKKFCHTAWEGVEENEKICYQLCIKKKWYITKEEAKKRFNETVKKVVRKFSELKESLKKKIDEQMFYVKKLLRYFAPTRPKKIIDEARMANKFSKKTYVKKLDELKEKLKKLSTKLEELERKIKNLKGDDEKAKVMAEEITKIAIPPSEITAYGLKLARDTMEFSGVEGVKYKIVKTAEEGNWLYLFIKDIKNFLKYKEQVKEKMKYKATEQQVKGIVAIDFATKAMKNLANRGFVPGVIGAFVEAYGQTAEALAQKAFEVKEKWEFEQYGENVIVRDPKTGEKITLRPSDLDPSVLVPVLEEEEEYEATKHSKWRCLKYEGERCVKILYVG